MAIGAEGPLQREMWMYLGLHKLAQRQEGEPRILQQAWQADCRVAGTQLAELYSHLQHWPLWHSFRFSKPSKLINLNLDHVTQSVG